MREAKHLERENGTLRRKVAALEDKLGRLQDSDNAPLRPKRTLRTSASVAGLQGEVQKLKSQVRQLQKVRISENSWAIAVVVRSYPEHAFPLLVEGEVSKEVARRKSNP